MTQKIIKIVALCLVFITALTFWGCSFNQVDDEVIGKEMEPILADLLTAVKDGDQEKFATFFEDTVASLSDFEDGFNYSHELYQGDLVSVTYFATGRTGKHIVPGEHICYSQMVFNVATSEKEYKISVEFYTQYESKYPDDPYKIRKFALLDRQDENNESRYGFSQRHGVYYPGWLDE